LPATGRALASVLSIVGEGKGYPLDPETLYRQLGRLIETIPDFSGYAPINHEQLVWLGRAHALVLASGDLVWRTEFDMAAGVVQGPARADALKTIMLVLYKALASAELRAPASARGAFIPAGNRFDAFAAVTKVLQTATSDVLIVDPYMDETVLTDFGGALPNSVALRLMADQASVKSSLEPAARMWVTQHGTTRPLEVRFAAAKALHDRAIFIDKTTAWILTQSLKDFAKRSPAEIVRADDTASLKIAAYEAVWSIAAVVV
jgi:hypothetical protein